MPMTQQQAEEFFAVFYLGKHHIPRGMKPFGDGWKINHHGDLSTFDFDALTRLVFLAHDKCVRVQIVQGGPRCVGIVIWQRAKRDGSMFERHPTIEQAMEVWRKYHPMDTVTGGGQ